MSGFRFSSLFAALLTVGAASVHVDSGLAFHGEGADWPSVPMPKHLITPYSSGPAMGVNWQLCLQIVTTSVLVALAVSARWFQCGQCCTAAKDAGSEKKWWYKDPKGNVQGPFTTSQMKMWHEAGYFTPNLPLKFGDASHFVPLRSLFPTTGVPFRTLPQMPPDPLPEPPEGDEDWHRGKTDSEDEREMIKSWRSKRKAQWHDMQKKQVEREF